MSLKKHGPCKPIQIRKLGKQNFRLVKQRGYGIGLCFWRQRTNGVWGNPDTANGIVYIIIFLKRTPSAIFASAQDDVANISSKPPLITKRGTTPFRKLGKARHQSITGSITNCRFTATMAVDQL